MMMVDFIDTMIFACEVILTTPIVDVKTFPEKVWTSKPNYFLPIHFFGAKFEKEYENCYKMSTQPHSESFPVRLYLYLKTEKVLKFVEKFFLKKTAYSVNSAIYKYIQNSKTRIYPYLYYNFV